MLAVKVLFLTSTGGFLTTTGGPSISSQYPYQFPLANVKILTIFAIEFDLLDSCYLV